MIQAKNISKIYKKRGRAIAALKPCSLTLPDSGLVVIMGQTGSGKSTLLSILGGVQKPDSGKVIGTKNSVSFVFQNSMLLDDMTLEENISFVRELYPDNNKNTEALIKKVGLEDRLNNYPNELSGGEKQRAALLLAMLQNKAIFADEPTGSLDEEHARDVAEILKEFSLSHLVVVVTHDDDIFTQYADRTITMSGGEIVSDKGASAQISGRAGVVEDIAARPPRFGIRQTAEVAASVIKMSKTRFICLAISLLLAFLCVITFSNNIFSQEENRVYTALSSQNAVCMDFVKTDGENFQPLKMTEEQLNYYLTKFDASYFVEYQRMPAFSIDGNILANGTLIYRTYVNDKCDLQILAGKSEIADGETAISDYVASEICSDYWRSFGVQLSYADLIGEKFGGNTISAVYSTGYDGEQSYGLSEESFNAKYCTAYVNRNTFLTFVPSSTQLNYEFGDNRYSSYIQMNCSVRPFGYELLCGSDDDLKEGEVLLSDEFVYSLMSYDGELQDLVGTKVTLAFAEMRRMPSNAENLIAVADEQYTVAGIYTSQVYYVTFIMNEYDYPELYFKYSSQFTGYTAGISIAGCDLSVIKSAYAEGLSDGSFVRDDISNSYSWLRTIAIIAVFVIAVFIAISFVILLSFINDSVIKNMSTMGVLRALGVPPAKIAGIWLFQCALCFAAVFVAVVVLQALLVLAWNAIIASVVEPSISVVYYGWQSVLLTAGVLIVYLACAYAVIFSKVRRKSSADLVYGR